VLGRHENVVNERSGIQRFYSGVQTFIKE